MDKEIGRGYWLLESRICYILCTLYSYVLFVPAFRNIQIPGSQVIPVPLFHVLDGKNSRDYIARVEPSSQGGRKMAEYLLDRMNDDSDNKNPVNYGAMHSSATTPTPITADYMAERS
jgi:hypothetical protein